MPGIPGMATIAPVYVVSVMNYNLELKLEIEFAHVYVKRCTDVTSDHESLACIVTWLSFPLRTVSSYMLNAEIIFATRRVTRRL